MHIIFRAVLLCSLLAGIVYAQNASLSGLIIDRETQSPLGYSSVALFQSVDSLQAYGVLADSTGRFQISGIHAGEYYLTIKFLGYQPLNKGGIVVKRGDQITLENLALMAADLLLEEIEITGRQSQTFHKIDRQVFDASQFQNAQGGTATDILRNLPSVSVDALGEISVRGTTGFMVMINGKQVQTDAATILNQLPANAIEDIEILTTPSARFDPDGKAGIINIKTKRGAQDGIYILANGLWGLPSIEPYGNAEAARRYGADLTLNIKKGKWDIATGLDYRRDDVSGQRIGYVNTYIDQILTEFPSYGERSFDRENYTGRASVLFTPDSRQSVGFNLYAGKRTQYRTADILYDYQQRSFVPGDAFLNPEAYFDLYGETGTVYQNGELIDSLTYYNENLRVRRGDFLLGSVDYRYLFSDQSSLSASLLYERTILGGPTDNFNYRGNGTADTLQYQYNTNDNPLDGVRVKLDYQRKLGETTWESGYQFRFLSHPGDFIYLERNLNLNTWETNPVFTNRIGLKRQIHSLYTQFSGTAGRLEYSAGLRVEHTSREVSTASPDTTYYLTLINPFPSVNLRYDLGKNYFLRGGYSRRIERTTTFKMTPFPEREHSETLEQGDAELLPEFIDLAELGVVKTFGDNQVFMTGYYRRVANVINRVNTIYNDSILNRIYTNAGTAQALGMEMGTTLYPAKIWKIYLGTNVYHYRIQGELFGDEINTSNVIYSINANTDLQLHPTFTVQLALNYLSERITAQGVDSRFYNPSLSLRKTFPQKHIALSLQWQSIDMGLLGANEQRITTTRDFFYTTTNYIYEVDRIMIGISYQFNQPGKKIKLINSEFGDKEF